MKISELIVESSQLNELTAKDLGRGVSKVAKGIGAAAGGVAGIPAAVKQGFQAGKQAVAGPDAAAANTATNANQQSTGVMGKLKQAASDFKQGYVQRRQADQAKKTAAPAQDPEKQTSPAAADDSADQQAAVDNVAFADLKKQMQSLLTRVANLEKNSQPLDDNPNIVRSDSSIVRKDPAIKG